MGSSARRASSTSRSRRSWSSTSVAGRPSSRPAPPRSTGAVSIPVGSVRLTEQQLQSDPPAPEELSNAFAIVDAHLDDVLRELPAVADAATLVGIGGTITTIAAVEIGLAEYDRDALHRFVLDSRRCRRRVPHPRDRAPRRPSAQPRPAAAIEATSSSAVAACSSPSCAGWSSRTAWSPRPTCWTASPTSSRLL